MTLMSGPTLCLGLAFIGAGFSELWPQLLLYGFGTVVVGALSFLLGVELERRTAAIAAAALGCLAVLAWMYGVLFAYESGWQGLEEANFGSDDLGHGHTYIWKSLLYGLFVVPGASALACVGLSRIGQMFAVRNLHRHQS